MIMHAQWAPARHPRLRRSGWIGLLAVLALACTSCDSVKFYEKERLAGPLMAFDESPSEVHFFTKNTYSREASVGGIGSSAGGGCGCY